MQGGINRPSRMDGLGMMLAVLTMLLLMTIGHAAPAVKLLCPALVTLGALYWCERSPPRYLQILLWTVILSPGLRHFVDWYAGYSQTNPIMLAPYCAVFATTGSVLRYLINGRRFSLEALILMLAVIFGIGLSLATGSIKDPMLAGVRWLAPIWVGIYICAHAKELAGIRDEVRRTFKIAIPAVAIYGIVQFVSILPWDAYFMKEAPITSIGFPMPFEVRVFGTMNSPGSLAAMLGSGLLLMLPRVRGLIWIPALIAMVLSTQRAANAGFLTAVVAVAFATGDRGLHKSIVKLLGSIAIALLMLLSVPGASKKLITTAGSFSHLQDDNSAQERWAQYQNVMPLLDNQKIGRGLGWATNDFYVSVGNGIAVDSGIIDIFVSLGVLGGSAFLFGLLSLVVQAWSIVRSDPDISAYGEFACVLFGVAQLPFGGQHTSEHGIFLYLGLGLLLARRVRNELPDDGVVSPIRLGLPIATADHRHRPLTVARPR